MVSSTENFGSKGEVLKPLGGARRTLESSIDAGGNILGGAGRLVFKPGERISGGVQMIRGFVDGLDIIPAGVADGIRAGFGPKNNSASANSHYNITRAVSGIRDVEKPEHVIGAVTDVAHAALFKLGSDGLKWIENHTRN